MSMLRSRALQVVAGAALVLAIAATVEAQFGRRGGGRNSFNVVQKARPEDFDGLWHFCRVAFNNDFRGDLRGSGSWYVDFPKADINLSIRLSELTKTPVSKDDEGQPLPLVIQLTDAELFNCPFIMMTEVGAASFNAKEAEALRNYLLKGGFLWVDDFWGDYAWDWWEAQMAKVLPPNEYPFMDLPPDHPLFHAQFEVKQTPQISSISFWAGTGGNTSERGEESATVHTRAILDKHGHIMVLATHNTDLGDSFEREAEDPTYFYNFSVPGYSFGINALLYAMTH
jgi:hypothetical protein